MFCPQCGLRIPPGRTTCIACAVNRRSVAAPPPAVAQPAPSPAAPFATGATNGYAIASLVLGIVWAFGIGAILAVIFGHRAMKAIDDSQGRAGGRGLAVAGVVLGYAGIAGLLVFLGVALPNASAARHEKNAAAQENSATAALANTKSVLQALVAYDSQYSGYPQTLPALGGDGGDPPSAEAAELIDSSLADAGTVPYQGYTFTFAGRWRQQYFLRSG